MRTVNAQTNVATVTSTYYVRDAQGNVPGVYDNNNTSRVVRQSELHLYGSSRLGLFKPNGNRPAVATNGIYTRRLGRKEYELTDHLGNVRAVVGDYRETDGANPVRAALRSYFNHYAFGLEMPGMNWRGGGYGYGYNGKEQDGDQRKKCGRVPAPQILQYLNDDRSGIVNYGGFAYFHPRTARLSRIF